MSAFTTAQRAELRDAIARSRLEYDAERARAAKDWQERRRTERAGQRALNPPSRRRRTKNPLPAKSDPPFNPTREESEIADRLMAHIATDSIIDRRRHALGVARMIVRGHR
jgi:hypothetical protein